jgi:hypothetical protein
LTILFTLAASFPPKLTFATPLQTSSSILLRSPILSYFPTDSSLHNTQWPPRHSLPTSALLRTRTLLARSGVSTTESPSRTW